MFWSKTSLFGQYYAYKVGICKTQATQKVNFYKIMYIILIYTVLVDKNGKCIFHNCYWTMQDSLLPRVIVLLLFSFNDFLLRDGDLPPWTFIRRSNAGTCGRDCLLLMRRGVLGDDP